MPALRVRILVLLALTAVAVLALAGAAFAQGPTTPSAKTLYKDGPSGRYLMDGPWLFRLDKANAGLEQHFMNQTAATGWSPTKVPNAWNATDESTDSFNGTVGWYRKDFKLPSTASSLNWIVRFESVNYRSRVYLNGHLIGTNRGAYLPFEIRLPSGDLKRGGTNRLVVRVENHRFAFDFPPAGLSVSGAPTGGWWNYGGLLREVYLRKINRIDFSNVIVRPNLPCGTCAATILVSTTLHNFGSSPVRTTVAGNFGSQKLSLGTAVVAARGFTTLSRTIRVAHPRLWSPTSPSLYTVRLLANAGANTLQSYYLQSGIRSIKVVNGHLMLNGRPLNFRGVGLHEDDPKLGFAINNTIRDRELSEVQDLGATLVRSHYPLHPYTMERADQLGIMLWSEIPVYGLKTDQMEKEVVRQLAANELANNIRTNGNHPSIIVWSVGNELSAKPGRVLGAYFRKAADRAHALDPSRPVGYAVSGYPGAGCRPQYAPLDVLGFNEYFGWYPGPNGQIADPSLMSAYLDSVHACYPKKAIVVTETGAEANRDGPVEERGTFQFQSAFANFHFGVYATKPWLSGAIWWALEEFRVRPGWNGGNPRPDPPIHEKGLITFAGVKKPAWYDVQKIYKSTKQIG